MKIKSLQELEILIAEKVMNRKPDLRYYASDDGGKSSWISADTKHEVQEMLNNAFAISKDHMFKNSKIYESKHYPHYAQDISEAWKVVEKIKEDKRLTIAIGEYINRDFFVSFDWHDSNLKVVSGSICGHKKIEIAICLSALKAKGVDVELNLEKEKQND